jgi:phenylacetate-CoA ligase
MLFQYNPLMHHVEVTENDELCFSISRPSLVSPRLRYNIHDEGGVLRLDQLREILEGLGVDLDALTPGCPRPLNLPLLWVHGRKDHTVSVMGANIYPEDLEQCLYAEPGLAAVTRSFCMGLEEGAGGAVRPCFAFEVDGPRDEALASRFQQAMLEGLTRLNADFRAARQEYPETLVPSVQLHGPGQGPFAAQEGRIKQIRIFNPATRPTA